MFKNDHFQLPIIINYFQSPAPICMFYFSHPFGIATPLQTAKSTPPIANTKRIQQQYTYIYHNNNNNNLDESTTKQQEFCRNYYPQCKFQLKRGEIHNSSSSLGESHTDNYIPWPKETWSREFILPQLVEMMASRMGKYYLLKKYYIRVFLILY